MRIKKIFSSAKRINSAVEDMLETFIYIYKKVKNQEWIPAGPHKVSFFCLKGDR